jgi:hypothetical protein
VKVRGTAQTVADKYMQLARDAQSSGDTVMAENYYQHAEHYLRILAAAQAYNQQHMQPFRRPGDSEELGEPSPEEAPGASAAQPEPEMQPAGAAEGAGPQPESRGYDADARQFRRGHDDRQRRQFERARTPNDQPSEPRPSQSNGGEAGRQWEAPSFLRRSTVSGESGRDRRVRFERPAREEPAEQTSAEADGTGADTAQRPLQGE